MVKKFIVSCRVQSKRLLKTAVKKANLPEAEMEVVYELQKVNIKETLERVIEIPDPDNSLTNEEAEQIASEMYDSSEVILDASDVKSLEITVLEDEADKEQEYGEIGDYHYIPSATAGDYSPSHPWDAPGMSIHDFI